MPPTMGHVNSTLAAAWTAGQPSISEGARRGHPVASGMRYDDLMDAQSLTIEALPHASSSAGGHDSDRLCADQDQRTQAGRRSAAALDDRAASWMSRAR